MKPDALIMSDPGLIMMVVKPGQMQSTCRCRPTVNYASVKFWRKSASSASSCRVNYRSMKSPKSARSARTSNSKPCPRCAVYRLLRSLPAIGLHSTGTPTRVPAPPRWKYDTHEAKETDEGDIVAANPEQLNRVEPQQDGLLPGVGIEPATPIEDQVFLLQEEGRPGEYMPAYETNTAPTS